MTITTTARAREIAAGYISPADADAEMTRFATSGEADPAALLRCIEHCERTLLTHPAYPDSERAEIRAELTYLRRWVGDRQAARVSTPSGRSALRFEITADWDDPWTSALMAAGGVCDVLEHTGWPELIPGTMGYSPGAGGPDVEADPAAMVLDLLNDGLIAIGDLGYWARVLDRYADLVPEDQRS